ncbi:S100 calcium binding protein W [Garra rufa]|uniref:S100 calcium binding protein W n=1 Tax=Garra rufa TaxID=137080 RepID=UPI003CCEB27B
MASKLEQAIVAIVEVFEEYAGKDDQKKQLSNAELGELIKAQITSPEFKDKVDPDNIKEVMEDLDKNHDGELNFREFSQCIAGLARAYYVKKHGKDKCQGKGRGCQNK